MERGLAYQPEPFRPTVAGRGVPVRYYLGRSSRIKLYLLLAVYSHCIFFEYIQAAISKAFYEVIDDEEPHYGEVPDLKGVWATGKTQEECRENLRMAIEDWIAFSLRFNLPIPVIEGQAIKAPVEA